MSSRSCSDLVENFPRMRFRHPDLHQRDSASARTISAGHAFVQNLRRRHYASSADLPIRDRVRAAFDDLALSV
ncbi:MAG TPA: hypothetical protein VGJ59_14200 [Jatrophihabitantaceae bacterium]|jgi:hypothetical protein